MDATWAIVELMGRNVIAGRISEELIAGTPMLRVDVPACEGEPQYTKFYSGQAVYGITPTDEATALRAVKRLHVAPVAPYIVAPDRQLPAPAKRDQVIPSWEEVQAERAEVSCRDYETCELAANDNCPVELGGGPCPFAGRDEEEVKKYDPAAELGPDEAPEALQ